MVQSELPHRALNSGKFIGCQSHDKCLAKHFKVWLG